jgi:hypothetical protein
LIKQKWFRDLVQLIAEVSGDKATGRRRSHAHSTTALVFVMNQIFRSQAEVEAFIRSRNNWEALRRELARLFPNDSRLNRGAPKPTRSVIRHLKERLGEDFGHRLRRTLEADAIIRAAEMGLGRNTGTQLEPSRDAILFGDGVTIRALSKHRPGSKGLNTRTGELKLRRHDPDASFHTDGKKENVYGNQFCHLSAFSGFSGETITFSVHPIVKGGDATEAQLAVEMATVVKGGLSGFAALAWDKALRSMTIDAIWQLRLQPLVGVHDKTGKTTEMVPLDVHVVDGVTVQTYAHQGAVCIAGLDRNLVVLMPQRLTYHPNRSGTWRAYGHFRIPEGSNCDTRLWGKVIKQRLNTPEESDLCFGEHVRAIPPLSPLWNKLYGNRSLAESVNSRYQTKLLPGQRARSYGQTQQWIDFMLWILISNTTASLLFRQRTGRSPSALAAAA